MYRRLDRFADLIARTLALLGGAVLLVLVILKTVSIIGRAFVPLDIGIRPIRGIYDITEIGMAVAIFAFLPWAQLKETHARVDLFQTALPGVINRLLDLLFHIAMFAFAGLMTWRMVLGAIDKRSFGETTLIADIPVWWGYAAGLVGACGFTVVAAFCIIRSLRRLAFGGVAR